MWISNIYSCAFDFDFVKVFWLLPPFALRTQVGFLMMRILFLCFRLWIDLADVDFVLIWQIKAILTFGLCSTFVLCYECHCVPVTLWWKIAGPVANWVILISHSHLVWISAILNLIFCVFLILNSIRLRSLCFWEIANFLIFKTLILFAVGFFDDIDSFCTRLRLLTVGFDIDLILTFVEVNYAFLLVLLCFSSW